MPNALIVPGLWTLCLKSFQVWGSRRSPRLVADVAVGSVRVEVVRWHRQRRAGSQLWCADYGGSGLPVILLHGLAGYAGEWAGTASWLSQSHRVVAPEQRGHGRSEREPEDVSRDAFVGDVEAWVEELALAPGIVVGQSLGGHTAFLLAARRPDLVRGLVVAEATPEADPDAPTTVGRWLDDWPVPFASRADAVTYFGGDEPSARAWAGGLERRGDVFWPAFTKSVMLAALDEVSHRSYWNDWARIRCPVLVVRAAGGPLSDTYARMVKSLPTARLVKVEDAGHDLHLDQPERWREALEEFLAALDP